MRIVKRYSNRKLYDTRAKRYVRLDEIASLIRGGERVRVVDTSTERDLTTVTLSRILVERELRRRGPLPKSFFTAALRAEEWPREVAASRQGLLRTVARLEHRVASLERELARQKKTAEPQGR